MSGLEKQLTSSLEFLTLHLGSNHKETIETRRMLVLEWVRKGKVR